MALDPPRSVDTAVAGVHFRVMLKAFETSLADDPIYIFQKLKMYEHFV